MNPKTAGVYSATVAARTARLMGVVAGCLAAMAAADPRPVFGVGVLRRDGIVIPFATFDGKRWATSWPLPKLDLTVPTDLRAVPKSWWGPTPALETWEAWTGAPLSQALTVTGPDWVDVHCVRQVGLKTTYRPAEPAPPPTLQPYPKDGFAVSPPQPVEAIELLSPSAPELKAIAGELLSAFNKAERQVESDFGHPIRSRAREGKSPEIEAAYAYGEEPRVYYIEATRSYRRLGQPVGACEAVAFGTGWFAREHGKVQSLSTAVDLLRCDRYGASYMFPFGVLRLDGKVFWVAQFSGWDRERFVVVEIKAKTVEARINVFGGGC
jgi:hypothetical protein